VAVREVPPEGIAVVRGENGATASPGRLRRRMLWAGNPQVSAAAPVLGELEVPEGAVAYLSHDDEHGCNGIGPGHYTSSARWKRPTSGSWWPIADAKTPPVANPLGPAPGATGCPQAF